MPELLKEKELADMLKVSGKTARTWGQRVGARRVIGGAIRYDAGIVREALESSVNEKTCRGRLNRAKEKT